MRKTSLAETKSHLSRKSYFTRPEVDGLLGAFGSVARNISVVDGLLASRR